MRALLIAAMLATGIARPTVAQLGFLEGLFKNVEDVELGIVTARLLGETPLDPRGLRGFMVEVSFGAPVPGRAGASGQPRSAPTFEVELALGYGQLTGFGTAAATYQLTGTVEELPSIVAYLAYRPDGAISPYLGVRTGLARLHGFRAYAGDERQLHTATGSTYLLGGSLGVAVGGEAIMVFVEGSLVYRQFPSVEWSAVANAVPAELPRVLPFSTAGLSAGIQVALKPRAP